MNPGFIHLRIHTEYSLIDGLVQIQPLMEAAVTQRMPALAITDQSNLFAAIKFYQAALEAGIKPLMGVDIWLEQEEQSKQPFRCSLFCQNQQGYQNLLELISKSFCQGQFLDKPIVKRAWLQELNSGLLVLSGAREGDVGQALLNKDEKKLTDYLSFWSSTFPERYYLELQRTGRAQEEDYIQAALILAETHNLPVVATNDVRFLLADDFEAHEARVCIHAGNVLSDPKRPHAYTEQQYFRSPQEMQALFADIPAALANTVEIAKRCNVTLNLGKYFLPHFLVPENYTTETYLVELAKQGLEERLAMLFDTHAATFAFQRQAYDNRLAHELEVILTMGFAGYFLIVADFIGWARNNKVPVGPGRGSGPGSLVAFSLKITDLDPLAHDLLFERFLNPERVSMPDFDIDFCMEGRDRVIDYVMQAHGHESVAQIITYGTMAARAVVRDVGRVLGLPYGQVDKIAKLIPFELGMTLDKALEQEPLLRERYEQEEEIRVLMELARKLEGTTRNVGKHAGGVVIAPGRLTAFTPLFCEQGAPEHVVTQFDKDDVETVGLVKFDFLGLRTLTTVDWAVQDINNLLAKNNESLIDIHRIPIADAKTFTLLKNCQTTAVFQLESRGMKDLVKRLQPDCFEDIVALVALFRPGPLQSGMVDDFISRKHGRSKVSYPHPKLEPILRPTYGVIVYQEQVMQIAQSLAGYTLGAADLLRRAMGKKKAEEMAKQRETFCHGAVARGVKADVAEYIFDLMEKFAGYGFNKSHSASYALIAYQTAWLKAHYPAAYMAAVLSSDMDHTDKVVHFIEECKALKLEIDPPDINESEYRFKVVDTGRLRYGLGAVKGAGHAAIEAIVQARQIKVETKHTDRPGLPQLNASQLRKDETRDIAEIKPFKDLYDFCHRVDSQKMNKRTLEALIKAGAFDSIGPHRASIMASLPSAVRQAEQTSRDASLGQQDLFGNITVPEPIDYIAAPVWSEQIRLTGEKETLGLYLSGHPIHRHLPELSSFITHRISELRAGTENAIIPGIVTQIRSIQTKRGDRMAIISLDDGSGYVDVLCFADNYQKYHEVLVKDKLLVVTGEVSIDEFNGGHRVVAKEFATLEQARERYAKYIKIHFAQAREDAISLLANLLEPHKGGQCHVAIDYQRSDATAQLKLGDEWRIRPTDALLNMLRELFTEQNVMVVY